MKKFFFCYNNGVTAIVDEATLASITNAAPFGNSLKSEKKAKFKSIGGPSRGKWRHLASECADLHLRPAGAVQESPWFTGDTGLMDALIEHQERGDVFQDAGFYVPFSTDVKLAPTAKNRWGRALLCDHREAVWEIFGVRVSEPRRPERHLISSSRAILRESSAPYLNSSLVGGSRWGILSHLVLLGRA